jgi:hypothetical protein
MRLAKLGEFIRGIEFVDGTLDAMVISLKGANRRSRRTGLPLNGGDQIETHKERKRESQGNGIAIQRQSAPGLLCFRHGISP